MSIATAHAIAVIGVEGFPLDIEASTVRGTPWLHLYGLPDATARKTRNRVQAAVTSAGLYWPHGQITVSLLPASLPKHGSSFDLAIAVAALAAHGTLSPAALSKAAFVAELGPDGSLRPVRAMTPAAMAAARAGCSTTRFPADVQLLLTTAPCPCGAPRQRSCECDPHRRARYIDRLLSRLGNSIDITIDLDDQPPQTPMPTPTRIASAQAAARIAQARARASSRLADTPWAKNGHIPLPQMRRRFMPSAAALRPLETAVQAGALSIRTAVRIIRIAWTISDLAGLPEPKAEHIETALKLSHPTLTPTPAT